MCLVASWREGRGIETEVILSSFLKKTRFFFPHRRPLSVLIYEAVALEGLLRLDSQEWVWPEGSNHISGAGILVCQPYQTFGQS